MAWPDNLFQQQGGLTEKRDSTVRQCMLICVNIFQKLLFMRNFSWVCTLKRMSNRVSLQANMIKIYAQRYKCKFPWKDTQLSWWYNKMAFTTWLLRSVVEHFVRIHGMNRNSWVDARTIPTSKTLFSLKTQLHRSDQDNWKLLRMTWSEKGGKIKEENEICPQRPSHSLPCRRGGGDM